MESGSSRAIEKQLQSSDGKHGGWITFPFIIATMTGLTLTAGGWTGNLIVYLIEKFNVQSIDAAQIGNIVNGCTTLFPVVGAIVADSFLGCFSVIWISSFISLLGIIILLLTATLDSLRPPQCESGSNLCLTPSKAQLGVLYAGLALAAVGMGGTRFTIGTMGADQFINNQKHQGTFFNWYFFTMYTSSVVSSTAIVYVQDSVSWGWGFGICLLTNALGLLVFLLGTRFYRHVKPQGSPFFGIACVVAAAISKRKKAFELSSAGGEDYMSKQSAIPTKSFKFLNYAALITEEDVYPDGSIMKSWKLCTVEQVEDLKTLIRILPLWSTGIFLSTPLAIQMSMTVLQALTMDRHLGNKFEIPAGTMIVFVLLSTSISLTVLDRFLFPAWNKRTNRPITPLQRVGAGHVLTVLSMVVSALVESKRLRRFELHKGKMDDPNGSSIVPMSVFWLVLPLALAGIGEAFHFPAQVGLYYQEFPEALRSTSTGVVALFIGIAFYLSTALVDFIRRITSWLPNDINHGRIDNVYWVLVAIGVANFVYYLTCASFYKYQNADQPQPVRQDSSRNPSLDDK